MCDENKKKRQCLKCNKVQECWICPECSKENKRIGKNKCKHRRVISNNYYRGDC